MILNVTILVREKTKVSGCKNGEHTILNVETNREKYLSFSSNFDRFNAAKRAGFYFECLWILYATLEDRTSALLYYLGFTSEQSRNRATGSKNTKKRIRVILQLDNKQQFGFNTMSKKLKHIERLLEWAGNNSEDSLQNDYDKCIHKAMNKLWSKNKLLPQIVYLNEEWRPKRNQLMHELISKNPTVVSVELEPLIELGYLAMREVDKAVTSTKKLNIRQNFRIK